MHAADIADEADMPEAGEPALEEELIDEEFADEELADEDLLDEEDLPGKELVLALDEEGDEGADAPLGTPVTVDLRIEGGVGR
jgi:hypothetical protein